MNWRENLHPFIYLMHMKSTTFTWTSASISKHVGQSWLLGTSDFNIADVSVRSMTSRQSSVFIMNLYLYSEDQIIPKIPNLNFESNITVCCLSIVKSIKKNTSSCQCLVHRLEQVNKVLFFVRFEPCHAQFSEADANVLISADNFYSKQSDVPS